MYKLCNNMQGTQMLKCFKMKKKKKEECSETQKVFTTRKGTRLAFPLTNLIGNCTINTALADT